MVALVAPPIGLLAPIIQIRHDLVVAHQALVTGAKGWGTAPLLPNAWGIGAKRLPVTVPSGDPLVVGGLHPFAEVVNQLATIERLHDTIDWIMTTQPNWTHVHHCNPTTSNKGHDLAVGDTTFAMAIFEISDVAGAGNANGKMVKDLNTVTSCMVTGCICALASRYLATSHSSGQWLLQCQTKGRYPGGVLTRIKLQFLAQPPDPGTWIVQVL